MGKNCKFLLGHSLSLRRYVLGSMPHKKELFTDVAPFGEENITGIVLPHITREEMGHSLNIRKLGNRIQFKIAIDNLPSYEPIEVMYFLKIYPGIFFTGWSYYFVETISLVFTLKIPPCQIGIRFQNVKNSSRNVLLSPHL